MPERRGLVAVSAVGRVAAVAVPDPVRTVRVALQEDVLEDVLVGGRLAVIILVDGVEGIAGGEEGLGGGDSIVKLNQLKNWEDCYEIKSVNSTEVLNQATLDPNKSNVIESHPSRFLVKIAWYMFFWSTPTYCGKGPSGKGA